MFFFKVEYWDSIESEPKQVAGLLKARSYKEATATLAEEYESIISLYLEEWESVLTTEEILDGFARNEQET